MDEQIPNITMQKNTTTFECSLRCLSFEDVPVVESHSSGAV